VLVGAGSGFSSSADSGKPYPRGQVVFQADFEGSAALAGWSGNGRLVGDQQSQVLSIERPAKGRAGSATVSRRLPVEGLRGYLVYVSARVKAENVSEKPNPWNGIKVMAPMVAKDGSKLWPQAEIGVGTFDWVRVSFPVRVPLDAKEWSLTLGLEAVTGKAWFDDVRITVRKPPVIVRPQPPAGAVYKGHSLPRLRGAMISPSVDEASLRVLGEKWNANLIRWQLIRTRRTNAADPLDLAAYDHWLAGELQKLDSVLPWCEKYGLLVVVDLHSPPGGGFTSGGYAGSGQGLFTSAACQKKFVEVWQHIARRYRDARCVWGYDLANEPVENVVAEDLLDWEELALRTARAIRTIDADRTIIVEPDQWGNPEALRHFQPLDVPNVVYSVHMYLPHRFTHQGVHNPSDPPLVYPGTIDGQFWDKEKIEQALAPVVEFQKRYGVHVYIGEFSAIRWAPDNSAYRYLSDLVDVFESHGWDWSYHAFREWDGWSVEHGSQRADRSRAAEPTDREKLLRLWFAKNRKP
jgi:hypothetical protein